MLKKIIITVSIFAGLYILMQSLIYYASIPTAQKELVTVTDNEWQQLASDESVIQTGKVQFQLRCYKCHGYNGEGNLKGPSLIDDEWLYPNDFQTIYQIIHDGIPEKGKYGNASKLFVSDMKAMTVYIKSLSQ